MNLKWELKDIHGNRRHGDSFLRWISNENWKFSFSFSFSILVWVDESQMRIERLLLEKVCSYYRYSKMNLKWELKVYKLLPNHKYTQVQMNLKWELKVAPSQTLCSYSFPLYWMNLKWELKVYVHNPSFACFYFDESQMRIERWNTLLKPSRSFFFVESQMRIERTQSNCPCL